MIKITEIKASTYNVLPRNTEINYRKFKELQLFLGQS
jgi:hypothetical protein